MTDVVKQEERIAALEKNVQWLTEGYKDLAYEFTDSLAKRIEDIRAEVMQSLQGVENRVFSEAFEKIRNAVEDARKKISDEIITTSVVDKLTDGSHVLVTRPASLAETRSGAAVPVKLKPR